MAAYKRVLTMENFKTVSKKWLPSLTRADRLIVYERFQLWRFDGENCGVLGWWSLIVAGVAYLVKVKFMIYIAIPLPPEPDAIVILLWHQYHHESISRRSEKA